MGKTACLPESCANSEEDLAAIAQSSLETYCASENNPFYCSTASVSLNCQSKCNEYFWFKNLSIDFLTFITHMDTSIMVVVYASSPVVRILALDGLQLSLFGYRDERSMYKPAYCRLVRTLSLHVF